MEKTTTTTTTSNVRVGRKVRVGDGGVRTLNVVHDAKDH